MLQPKKTKFRRQQKGRMKGNAHRGTELSFGSFGIKTLESAWLTGQQIEAARQAVVRYMKREGKIWIRVFPDKPYTKKRFGFAFSLTNLTQRNRRRYVWVKVKVIPRDS